MIILILLYGDILMSERVLRITDYDRGFEDAIEMALTIVNQAKTIEEAREKLEILLGAIIDKKTMNIKEYLVTTVP